LIWNIDRKSRGQSLLFHKEWGRCDWYGGKNIHDYCYHYKPIELAKKREGKKNGE